MAKKMATSAATKTDTKTKVNKRYSPDIASFSCSRLPPKKRFIQLEQTLGEKDVSKVSVDCHGTKQLMLNCSSSLGRGHGKKKLEDLQVVETQEFVDNILTLDEKEQNPSVPKSETAVEEVVVGSLEPGPKGQHFCPHCPQKFKTFRGMKIHSARHSPSSASLKYDVCVDGKYKYRYRCNHCNRLFVSTTNLKNHQKKHCTPVESSLNAPTSDYASMSECSSSPTQTPPNSPLEAMKPRSVENMMEKNPEGEDTGRLYISKPDDAEKVDEGSKAASPSVIKECISANAQLQEAKEHSIPKLIMWNPPTLSQLSAHALSRFKTKDGPRGTSVSKMNLTEEEKTYDVSAKDFQSILEDKNFNEKRDKVVAMVEEILFPKKKEDEGLKYGCFFCDDWFANVEEMQFHLLCNHEKEIGKSATYASRKRQQGNEYCCDICAKKFSCTSELCSHWLNTHNFKSQGKISAKNLVRKIETRTTQTCYYAVGDKTLKQNTKRADPKTNSKTSSVLCVDLTTDSSDDDDITIVEACPSEKKRLPTDVGPTPTRKDEDDDIIFLGEEKQSSPLPSVQRKRKLDQADLDRQEAALTLACMASGKIITKRGRVVNKKPMPELIPWPPVESDEPVNLPMNSENNPNHNRKSESRINNSELDDTVAEDDPRDPDYDHSVAVAPRSRKPQAQNERFQCPKCNQNFTVKTSLSRHYDSCSRLHGNVTEEDRKNTCKICGQIFLTQWLLNYHIARLHSYEKKKYECELCSARFTEFRSIARHQFFVHKIRSSTYKPSLH